MGLCFTRDKDETQTIKYEGRHVYCNTCLAKVRYDDIYIVAHTPKIHVFCSRECYGRWVNCLDDF